MKFYRIFSGALFTLGFMVAVFFLAAKRPTHDFTAKYLVEMKGERGYELTISCRGKEWAYHQKVGESESRGVQSGGVLYIRNDWASREGPSYSRVLDKEMVEYQPFWYPDPLIINRKDAEVTNEEVAGQPTKHYRVKMEYGKVRELWIHDSFAIVLADRYYSTDAGESEEKPNLYFHAVEYKDSAQPSLFEIEEPMKSADAESRFMLLPRSLF